VDGTGKQLDLDVPATGFALASLARGRAEVDTGADSLPRGRWPLEGDFLFRDAMLGTVSRIRPGVKAQPTGEVINRHGVTVRVNVQEPMTTLRNTSSNGLQVEVG